VLERVPGKDWQFIDLEKGNQMRRLFLLFVLAVGAVATYGVDNASVSGKWHVHTSAAGYESDYACTFTQKDSDLTGSCTPDEGMVQISGKVEGKLISWSYKGQYGNISFKGTLDPPTKITGKVTAADYGVEGEFVATQSQ